jgi:hypothetical protein
MFGEAPARRDPDAPGGSRAWNRRTNRNRVTINWTFDRKKARKKFKYKYKTKRSMT